MSRIPRLSLAALAACSVLLPLLMAPGGLPSRPRFQAVTIGGGTPAGVGDLRLNAGSIGVGMEASAGDGKVSVAATTDAMTGSLHAESAQPGWYLRETDALLHAKNWLFYTATGSLIFELRDDAGAAPATWLQTTRSGAAVTDVRLAADRARFLAAGSSPLHLGAADAVGDLYVSFYEPGYITRKGYIGYGDQTGDNFHIWNEETSDMVIATGNVQRMNISAAGAITFPSSGGFTLPSGAVVANAGQNVLFADGAGSGGALGVALVRTNTLGAILSSRNVSSVTDVTGTGVWDVNFNAAIFDSSPTCSCVTTAAGQCAQVGTLSNIAARFETRNTTGTLTDLGMHVICLL